MKTSKQKAFWLAVIAGISGMASYIAVIPPSEQDNFISALVHLFPIGWRGEIGSVCRLIAVVSGIYATTNASHSGPDTNPKNDPNE